MSLSFLSREWNEALCAAINASASYREQAADWTHGPAVLGVDLPDGSTRYVRIDLDQGRCNGITLLDAAPDDVSFKLTAPLNVWQELLEQRLSPAAEIAKRRITFEGNWVLLAKYQDAARTLVDLTADLDTDFSTVEG